MPAPSSAPPASRPRKDAPVAPAPAATIACLRGRGSDVEVLLLQRRRSLAFHGGAWVFPGGRVEASDAADQDPYGEAAARLAGVREVAEEAALRLSPHALTCLSHWTTPPGRPRCFATWFFLCAEGADAAVQVDGGEILAHQWLTPNAALRAQARGELELPPPTFVTLAWLASRPTLEACLQAARDQPEPERFVPRPCATADGGLVSLYTGDAGYETRDAMRAGARHRLWMAKAGWRYERSPR